MLISHRKKFIFIHIFKTAGSSVRSFFLPYSRLKDRVFYGKTSSRVLSKIVGGKTYHYYVVPFCTGFIKHEKASAVKQKLASTYDNFYSFAFVRNPYDWLVSLYFYVQHTRSNQDYELARNVSFSEYIRHKINTGIELQSDFVFDENGIQIVSFIGKYETLDADMKIVCSKLGINPNPIPKENTSKKRVTKDYKQFFTDEDKDLVNNYFRKDFELFGYNQE